MPRKRKVEGDRYNNPFPRNLRALMERSGTSQQQLGDHLGKTRQTIGFYCDGSVTPDIDTLLSIAEYHNVSTDYLLGRTADPLRNSSAVDELGLTPDAVGWIKRLKDREIICDSGTNVLNFLLESPAFHEMFEQICCYYYATKAHAIYDEVFDRAFPKGGSIPTTVEEEQQVRNALRNALPDMPAHGEIKEYLLAIMEYSEKLDTMLGLKMLQNKIYKMSDLPKFRTSLELENLMKAIEEDSGNWDFDNIQVERNVNEGGNDGQHP